MVDFLGCDNMQMFLISDNVDTKTGMRLAGIDGVVVHESKKVKDALDKCLKNADIGIILITEKLGNLIPSYIDEIKLNYSIPLIVVIPDRHGTGRSQDSITKYIRESIGLKI